MTDITQEEVEKLRNTFLDELHNKGENVVHPADLERVRTNDLWVKRFLMHHESDQKLALDMLWDTIKWRKEFGANDITESNVRMDYVIEGGIYPRGRDKDGHAIFIFNCKKHVKGTKNMDELKRCVIYWFERMERQEKGKAITIFFDLEGCGLANMDLEFTKYIIGLFKEYYPYFLNYIIIYEMAWILNAAFKIIKSWLPPKAVQKIKVIKKPEVKEWVPLNYALRSWGGDDDYTFTFVPETEDIPVNHNTPVVNKKVHFADGSPMSETPGASGDKENDTPSALLSVTPSSIITFVKEGNELVSTLELQNIDSSTNISYKMKTTSPEKFRVRPSAGCLAPGAKTSISVTLLPGFQLGGLSRDKFLVMSMPVDSIDIPPGDLIDLWKNVSNKQVSQHRLRCAQSDDLTRNGNAIAVGTPQDDENHLQQLSSNVLKLMDCQTKLHSAVERTQSLQWVTIAITILFALVLVYIIKTEINDINTTQTCYKEP